MTTAQGMDELLGNAANRIRETFAALDAVHHQITPLADVRAHRSWTSDEHDRYISLLVSEQRALRAYLAARRHFDHIRRLSWRTEATG